MLCLCSEYTFCSVVFYGNTQAFVKTGLQGKMIRGQPLNNRGRFWGLLYWSSVLSLLSLHRCHMPSISYHLQLIILTLGFYKHSRKAKTSTRTSCHCIIQAFNFANEMREESCLPPVISEWTIIYFPILFGQSSTSLWSTFLHLQSTLETDEGWYVCPLGSMCVSKWTFSLLKIRGIQTLFSLDISEGGNIGFKTSWDFLL